jgi:hypothetical protein
MTLGSAQLALEKLGGYLREGRLVVFCGAGISSGRVPTAREFLQKNGFDRLPWRQALSLLDGEKPFQLDFARTFGVKKPSKVHNWLAQLNARWYITTNYDQLLDIALREYHGADQVGIITRDAELSEIGDYRCVCLKLHGDVEQRELLVMTSRDYRERIRRPKRVDALMRYLFASHPVLFIGAALDDENIIEMLEEDDRGAPAPPERYLFQLTPDAEREKYLRSLGIVSISDGVLPASPRPEDRNEVAARFLRRLWEQTSPFGDFLFHNDKQELRMEEKIGTAIDLRRRSDLEGAQRALTAIRKSRDRIPLNQLPRLLWLTVSLYDKLEKPEELEVLLDHDIEKWLGATDAAPPDVGKAILAAHSSALSVAHLRAFKFQKAWEVVKNVLDWQPTEFAQRDFHLLRANLHTIFAMVTYCKWIYERSTNDKSLVAALDILDEAEKIYTEHHPLQFGAESHHLGRYHGARAFIETALAQRGAQLSGARLRARGSRRAARSARTLEHAHRAHNNGINRTPFGVIAGQYCHAYVLMTLYGKDNKKMRDANKLIADALASPFLPPSINRTRQKLRLLQSKLSQDGASVAALQNELSSFLGGAGLDIEQWLKMPVN